MSAPSAPPTTRPTTCATTSRLPHPGCHAKVYPAFRPDKALNVHMPDAFNAWVARLEAVEQTQRGQLHRDFSTPCKPRHDFFHAMGGRLSDHGLNHCYADFCTEPEAAAIFDRARGGQAGTRRGTRAVRLLS